MDIDDLSDELLDLVVNNNYEYIRTKAESYLNKGPGEYRKGDFYNMPPEDISNEDLDQIKKGCEQILEYRGMTSGTAFEGLTVGGFYQLMNLFHFNGVEQKAHWEENIIIDEILFRHVVTGDEAILFNKPLVDY